MQQIDLNNYWEKYLPKLLILAGIGIVTISFGADQLGVGGIDGFGPNQISLALSGFVVLVVGIVLSTSVNFRYIGEWLLVLAGVFAAGFAADLFVIGGLPGFGMKQLMLTSVVFGVVLTAVSPSTTIGLNFVRDIVNNLVGSKEKVGMFLAIVLQLGLLVLISIQFELENQAFYSQIMWLVFYGFLIHFFLPIRYRLPFFLLLSFAAIAGILGFVNGFWLVGLGLVLIGITHLPISFPIRVLLILLVAGLLVAFRSGAIISSIPGIIWPILGSMFMFRLIIYLYDTRHEKGPVNIWRTLSYFFMLPNVVFPFFPVVDYATFRRTYYDKEQFRIYQTGLGWMFRGVIQLIIYRVINYYMVMAPEDVVTTTDLARFAVSNFLLYIRVSGQFHLIIGMLHLFGFNLPETHHQYFLSAGFTDLWRRINIYWKDFMLKVFYNPVYFKLRKLGITTSIMITTVVVFVLTWFFHAYQWFWLRGDFLFTSQDILFWSLLAILLIANTLIEMKRGRKRTLGEQKFSWRNTISLAVRVATTFTVMCILWSLWTGGSIADWLAIWSIAFESLESMIQISLMFLGMVAVFGIVILLEKFSKSILQPLKEGNLPLKPAMFNVGLLVAVMLIGSPFVSTRLGGSAGAVLEDLRVSRLSDREAELLQRGYYEDLIGVDRFNPDLWNLYTKRPTDWPNIHETELARFNDDFRVLELVPSKQMIFHGEMFTTNRWGMRDKEYTLTPPSNTYRIALLGPSFVMGSGVADEQVFESLLEERLNQENDGDSYSGYEILNFGVAGYSVLQELFILEDQVLKFEPNAVFIVSHQLEMTVAIRNLAERILAGEVPYDYLNDIASQAEIRPGMPQSEVERLLEPYGREIVKWAYDQIVLTAKDHGMVPVWVFIPALEMPVVDEDIAMLKSLAEERGFVTIDLADAYAGQDLEKITVAVWDRHPNAKGHQLLAERLYQELAKRSEVIPIWSKPQ